MRCSKSVTSGGTTTQYGYFYSSGQLLQMNVGSDTLSFAYDTAGAPYSVKYNGTTYYYITDLQGDVTAIVNGSGVSVAEYTYNSWGKLLTATGTMSATLGALNPLRYRGYVYDAETGFYYLQSRYYDPGICRFISADEYPSTGQDFIGTNMFAYCLNNPVIRTDESGQAGLLSAIVVSGVIGAVWGAVNAAISGDDILAGAISGAAMAVVSVVASPLIASGINFLIGAGTNIYNQVRNNSTGEKKINIMSAVISGTYAAVGTYVGGSLVQASASQGSNLVAANAVTSYFFGLASGIFDNATRMLS